MAGLRTGIRRWPVSSEHPQAWREAAFLASALAPTGVASTNEFREWFATRSTANHFDVQRVPISSLEGWRVERGTGNIVHESGRFFRIEGIEVATSFGPTPVWNQPIINQPEIGILGFLTKEIDGVLHFLVQAKMEPGNVNMIQVSPTVQATHSNFTQVHGGNRPPYLEYFLDPGRAQMMVDQLQSEQGSRFLKKRNRNMIVRVPSHEQVQLEDDFFWLTLGQLSELLQTSNLVNMDTRTVLSSIRLAGARDADLSLPLSAADECFAEAVLESVVADPDMSASDFDTAVSWFTRMRVELRLETRIVPLNSLDAWEYDGRTVHHRTGRYFKVIGVSVSASNREVGSWQQPLIESAKGGVIAFVCQRRNEILHFLVQARVEPGNFDGAEMAPTLQCTPSNHEDREGTDLPPFYDLVMGASPAQIRYDSLQSEEGGRFYHDQNRYLVVEIDERDEIELPANYLWMTIRQLKEFIRFNNYLNIEARGLISCLPLAPFPAASS
jgi:oxidase EvaA